MLRLYFHQCHKRKTSKWSTAYVKSYHHFSFTGCASKNCNVYIRKWCCKNIGIGNVWKRECVTSLAVLLTRVLNSPRVPGKEVCVRFNPFTDMRGNLEWLIYKSWRNIFVTYSLRTSNCWSVRGMSCVLLVLSHQESVKEWEW